MPQKRRVFSAEFKAKVALEAIREQETINQIASRYDVLPAQVSHLQAFRRPLPPSRSKRRAHRWHKFRPQGDPGCLRARRISDPLQLYAAE